jgi:serine/threonine protein kinase
MKVNSKIVFLASLVTFLAFPAFGVNDGTTLTPSQAFANKSKSATVVSRSFVCVQVLKEITLPSVTRIDTRSVNRKAANLLNNIQKVIPNAKEIDHVATGGESAVYELILEDGTKKIIKITAKYNDRRVEASYRSEMELFQKIKSPYIAVPEQLIDIPNTGKGIVFPRAKWFDLDGQLSRFSYRERKGYPKENALINLKAWKQIAEAVQALHKIGLIHRDIKPANILVDENKDKSFLLQLTDFGVSKHMYDTYEKIAGTLSHMPPEQVQGVPASATHDLYSMRVTFVEMLMGESIWRWKLRDREVLEYEIYEKRGTYPVLKGIPKEVIEYSHPSVLRVLNLDYKTVTIDEYVRVINEEIKKLESQE